MDLYIRFKNPESTPVTYLPPEWESAVDWEVYDSGQPFHLEGSESFITAMWDAALAADDVVTAVVL